MMQEYPVKFDLVFGFESANDLCDLAMFKDDVDHCINGTSAATKGYSMEDVLKSFKFFHNYIGLADNKTTTPATKGLRSFMDNNQIHEDDFVVIKMDVEGQEYEMLEQIMKDGSHKLIDEVSLKFSFATVT